MNDDSEKKQQDIARIAKELSDSKLSRRDLLDRLKSVGVGFGAAFVLGMKQSDAHSAPEATAKLKSSNPALNNIIGEDSAVENLGAAAAEGRPMQSVAYLRGFRRVFRRVYRRF